MGGRTNVLRSLLVVLLVVVSANDVHAQSSKAEAESLFKQGRDLMAAGKVAEACDAFSESQRLDPSVSTLLNGGNCREKNGQLATAWGLFIEAEQLTRASSDAPTAQLHQVAVDRAAALEPRISKLTVTVSAESRVDGLEIVRGTEPVRAAAWNRPLPIDGGTYKIVARAPGFIEWSQEIAIAAEHDSKVVEIPRLQPAPEAPAVVPPTAPIETPAVAAEVPPSSPRRSVLVPAVFAAGAVALGAGALGFELWGRSLHDEAQRTLDAGDEDRANGLQSSANNRRYIAQGLGALAIGSAAVSIYFFVRRSSEPQPSTALRVTPQVRQDGAAFVIGGAF